LQTSCPYLLVELDARVGTVHDEQEIHSRHHRVRGLGEWFWFDSPEEARQAVAHLPPRTAYEVAVNRRAIAHASVLGGLEALEWSGEAGA
ncbi:MAG: GIY-YIG nuclease family protein, partial [Rhodospirillaceae bacterium]